MSGHRISWDAWYRRAAVTAIQMRRAQTERRHPSATLGAEYWAITPAGATALARVVPPSSDATHAACVWCGRPIRPGQRVTIVGGLPIHDRPCFGQFDAAADDTRDGGFE
jgi:hypothetical protein